MVFNNRVQVQGAGHMQFLKHLVMKSVGETPRKYQRLLVGG